MDERKRIKLKCIDSRLNYVGFAENGKPHRVEVGETFHVRTKGGKVPAKWHGFVQIVGDDTVKDDTVKDDTVKDDTVKDDTTAKKAVTNPAKGAVQHPAKASS